MGGRQMDGKIAPKIVLKIVPYVNHKAVTNRTIDNMVHVLWLTSGRDPGI